MLSANQTWETLIVYRKGQLKAPAKGTPPLSDEYMMTVFSIIPFSFKDSKILPIPVSIPTTKLQYFRRQLKLNNLHMKLHIHIREIFNVNSYTIIIQLGTCLVCGYNSHQILDPLIVGRVEHYRLCTKTLHSAQDFLFLYSHVFESL